MKTTQADFSAVFAQLKAILQKHEPRLVVVADTPQNYCLSTPYAEQWKKELMFGAVQIKKNYVSYHLVPVYVFPELLDGISDDLRRHMQGKACFNFKASDPKLFRELAQLTRRGVDKFKRGKLM